MTDEEQELSEALSESSVSVLELKANLASARAEIETGKQERTMMRGHEMASVIANARLVMAEEAARLADQEHGVEPGCNHSDLGCLILAAASLPASLVVLPVEVELRIRQRLWLGHGHIGQYGDDGEMQCAACMPFGVGDFKREPLVDLLNTLDAGGLAALSSLYVSLPVATVAQVRFALIMGDASEREAALAALEGK